MTRGGLRAVLFDLDGTLMDHEAARTAALAARVKEWLPGARGELEQIDAEWRRLEAVHYDEYTAGECSFWEQRRRRVHGLHAALGRRADVGRASGCVVRGLPGSLPRALARVRGRAPGA
jgi:FMN phosphatase YigB (HAD superfamily)